MIKPEDIVIAMTCLAQTLARATGEKDYASAAVEVNINDKTEWRCYTPHGSWTSGATWEEALEKQTSKEALAERLRRDAAELLVRAEKLESETSTEKEPKTNG